MQRPNELDLFPEWLRAQLELREPRLPGQLSVEAIVPVVDVLAARDDITIIGDIVSLGPAVAAQTLNRFGPAHVAGAVNVIPPNCWAYVLAVNAFNSVAGAAFNMAWLLTHQTTPPAITVSLRALNLALNQTYGSEGANAITTVTPFANPIQIAPAMLTRPWVIPPDYGLDITHGGTAAGGAAVIHTVVAICPRGVRL